MTVTFSPLFPGTVSKMSKIIRSAEEHDVPVVSEDFVDSVEAKGVVDLMAEKSICGWGSEVSIRRRSNLLSLGCICLFPFQHKERLTKIMEKSATKKSKSAQPGVLFSQNTCEPHASSAAPRTKSQSPRSLSVPAPMATGKLETGFAPLTGRKHRRLCVFSRPRACDKCMMIGRRQFQSQTHISYSWNSPNGFGCWWKTERKMTSPQFNYHNFSVYRI